MTLLSIAQLREPMTATEGLNLFLGILQSLGFETTGWQEGRIQHSIVKTLGIAIADFSEIGRILVGFGFNDYATGDALHEFSHSRFDNDYFQAVATEGPMKLTSTASVPYTIEVGQLIATAPDGTTFRNTTGGTLPTGSAAAPSSLVLQWKATVAGALGNVPRAKVTKLLTPLAGVTVTNDEGTAPDAWYTTAGKDEESDAALRIRNATKWATLSVERVADAYVNIALNNGAVKARVDDQNPRGAGTIDVYCAGANEELGQPQLAALQAAFADLSLQTDAGWPRPDPLTDDSRVSVVSPQPYPLSLSLIVYHLPSVPAATIQSDVLLAIRDLIIRTPLGGFSYSPSVSNVITIDTVLEAVRSVDGVVTATQLSPTSDFTVDPFAVVTEGLITITPQAVAT